jgi:hypothetical protein
MPVLSRGKHRRPRKGACFMELASYLAGEKWSDHPRCTHPLLAELARSVNDSVGDTTRIRLAPLIPDVIGVNGSDRRVSAWIARDAALAALPIAAAERQGVAAAGLLRCERHLAELEGRPPSSMSPVTAAALAGAPHARAWAENIAPAPRASVDSFDQRGGPAIVSTSVTSIAHACVPDPEDRLVELLERTIQNCRAWFRTPATDVSDDEWGRICALTH